MDHGRFRGRRARSACAAALLFAFGVLLSACGGGGGGDSASYSISTTSVSFSATQGGATPASQTVGVSVQSGTVYIATSQTGSEFSHSFVITGETTGQIVITPSAPNNAGTFIGTITVRGCSTQTCTGPDVPGSPKIINVTYTVSGAPTLTSSVATVDFATTTGVLPAAKNLNLSLSTGSAAWTSSVQYLTGANGWLVLAPSSGPTLPQLISLSVNSAATPGTHTASVTFSAGGIDKVVPVSLTVNDPRVNFVSPYVGTTNVGGNVIIRGFGFSAPGLAVDFGGNAATSVTFVSETEIRATYSPLPAGSYTVNVNNNAGPNLTTRATLVVVDPPAFPAETIARQNTPGAVGNLVYDAERRAIFLMDADRRRLEAYRHNGANWVLDGTTVTASSGLNNRVALSPDGTELLMTAGLTMRRINPATLGIIGDVDATAFLGMGGASLNLIAFGNDGGAVGSANAPLSGITLYRYDMLTQQFGALSTESSMTNRSIVAAGDGDTLVLPTFESLAPTFEKPLFTYDASLGTLTQRAVLNTGTENASVSRDGSRLILVNAPNSAQQVTTVYDASFTALGNLPADLRGFVISPDGSTAYAYFSGSGLVRKFDLNSPVGGGFTEVGVGVAVSSPGSFFSKMTISPDGGTLFLAGNERLIVVPAPP